MTDSERETENDGARAWELIYELFRNSKPHLETIASSFELTGQQMFALRQLSCDRPLMMSALASMLGCDASNVTSIVDKLETRGLVTRRSDENDRRVKALYMTESGIALRNRILDRMQVPPPAIDRLSRADQAKLCEILTRALGAVSVVAS